MEQYLEIGQIVGTHGVRGFIKVKPLTDDITRFSKLKAIYITIQKELVEFSIEKVQYKRSKPSEIPQSLLLRERQCGSSRNNKNMVLLKLKGIDTIEKAEEYRNFYIKINRKNSVKLPEDSYFIVDLLGCDVYDEGSNILGKVDDVYSTGSNDIYVVKDSLGKLILLPAIKDVIKNVDIQNRRIIVKLIEGLV